MTKELINHDDFDLDAAANGFVKKTLTKSALACGDVLSDHFDLAKAEQENLTALKSLGITSGLQMMLGSQMLAIHNLQKEMMTRAHTLSSAEETRYCANTAVKLSNTFVQQVTLLTKLQGNSNQKMTVEHVHVHGGAQAIVGNVQGDTQGIGRKK